MQNHLFYTIKKDTGKNKIRSLLVEKGVAKAIIDEKNRINKFKSTGVNA